MQQDDVAKCVAGVRRGTVAAAAAAQAYQYLTQAHNVTHCRIINAHFHSNILFCLFYF